MLQDFSPSALRRRKLRRIQRGIAWRWSVQAGRGAKRLIDVLGALLLLVIASPVLLIAALRKGSYSRETRVGRWCEPFQMHRLGAGRFSWLPALWNVLKGDMSFVGPRAARPDELSPRETLARRRYDVRPGLISLWKIRKGGNVDYGTEAETDAEYVETQTLRGDLGISLRAVPTAFYGSEAAIAPHEIELLRIRIDNLTMSEAIERIIEFASDHRPHQISFVNADCANIAWNRGDYRDALNSSDLCVADGIGVKLAGKLLAQPVKQNVNGTDLFPRLCAQLDSSRPLYLLGSRPGIAAAVADWVGKNHPNAFIAGAQHGYFGPEEEASVIRRIRESGARILLVAFGAPKQDLWIREHLAETGVGVAMGVGGLFDFYSGRIARAPQWMREIGMEWVYRLYQEPGRMWKRYLWGNLLFLSRVAREQVGNK
jgi:N-acetylglucosaminyldiphosphoundecaprenol N-acetyl-beta-D-mannosaminyltransferase